jgi:hypothetical protein
MIKKGLGLQATLRPLPPVEPAVFRDPQGFGVQGADSSRQDAKQVLDALETPVRDRIMEEREQTFRRLDLWRVGRKEDKVHAARHADVPRRVPDCAADHQHDPSIRPYSWRFGEGSEGRASHVRLDGAPDGVDHAAAGKNIV